MYDKVLTRTDDRDFEEKSIEVLGVSPDYDPVAAAQHAASATASLDPYETAVAKATCSPSDGFLHSHWAARRRRIIKALESTEVSLRQQSAFAGCGSSFWVLRSNDDLTVFKAVRDTCGNRWCEPCQKSRAHVIRSNLDRQLPDNPVRFLTLTLRSHGESLEEMLSRLYAGFRKLRASALWRDRVEGGIAFLEVTRGKQKDHWHPHLHVLLQGRFLPQNELAAVWLKVTGDSRVVDIRLVRSKARVIRYVAKYVTKTTSPSIHNQPNALIEAIEALRSKRTIIPFGTWRGMRLLHRDSEGSWKLYGHENQLAIKAYEGDELASTLTTILAVFGDCTSVEFTVVERVTLSLNPP